MEERRDWKRPVIVLAALGALTVAALAAPASAHLGSFGHLKKHIKKIAKQVAKKQATTVVNNLGTTLFVEETELTRFGQIKLNVGGSQTIGTFGPFTLSARCVDEPPGGAVDVNAQVEITTTEANSFYYSYWWGSETDFDPSDPSAPIFWVDQSGGVPGGPLDAFVDNYMTAHAPGGTSLHGDLSTFTNFAGSHCVFSGYVLQEAPA